MGKQVLGLGDIKKNHQIMAEASRQDKQMKQFMETKGGCQIGALAGVNDPTCCIEQAAGCQ